VVQEGANTEQQRKTVALVWCRAISKGTAAEKDSCTCVMQETSLRAKAKATHSGQP